MSNKIIHLNEGAIKQELKELVRNSVEETLNELLEKEAAELTNAGRYERTEERQGYRSGHYERNLTTTSGEVKLKMPKLKGVAFETAIIERYRRRESSVEEALIEMYLAGVSVRRVEDITEALWGTKVSAGTVSNLNKKVYGHIDTWRNRPLQGKYPYVYMDGIYLKRNWGGEYENVAILRNVFSVTPRSRMKEVAAMLKAIHAQENKEAAKEKAVAVAAKLKEMKLKEAAKKIEDGIQETLTYMDFPYAHWSKLRSNNVIER